MPTKKKPAQKKKVAAKPRKKTPKPTPTLGALAGEVRKLSLRVKVLDVNKLLDATDARSREVHGMGTSVNVHY